MLWLYYFVSHEVLRCIYPECEPFLLFFAYSAKGFQHQRMTNGAMNVEIGNPAYKIYDGEQDDDVGQLVDSDFTLDPDKVRPAEKTGAED